MPDLAMRHSFLSQPSPSPLALRHDQRGVTLLEMMAVVAICSILAALIVPNFEQFRDIYRLRGATREVFVELQKARMAAIKENNRYVFSLADDTHYRIHDDKNSDGQEENEPVTIKSIAADSPGVVLSADNATAVIFLPNGTVSFVGGFTASFSLLNASGRWKRIVISAGGGRIVILQ